MEVLLVHLNCLTKYAFLFLSSFTLSISILHALMAYTFAISKVLYCYSSVSSWCAPMSVLCSESICAISKTPITQEVETYLPIHCCLARLWWIICEVTRVINFLSVSIARKISLLMNSATFICPHRGTSICLLHYSQVFHYSIWHVQS
jgi:hypothetical protein